MIKILFALGLISFSFSSSPYWYEDRTYKPEKNYEYIGYGEGNTRSEANDMAKAEISKTIKSRISTKDESQKAIHNGKYSKNFSAKSTHSSNEILQDTITKDYIKYKDRHYIAVSFLKLSIRDRFVHNLSLIKSTKKNKQNFYLKNTNLFKDFNKRVLKKLDYDLIRKNKNWYLKYKHLELKLNSKDVGNIFTSVGNKNIKISLSIKGDLKEGDEFSISLKSSKKGYISLLAVYEDGSVAKMIDNKKVVKHKTLKYPDKDFLLEAGLIKENTSTTDLYVAIYNSNKINIDDFVSINDELIYEEKYKNMDKLFNLMNKYVFVSKKVITRP